jgi:hypothetical protein
MPGRVEGAADGDPGILPGYPVNSFDAIESMDAVPFGVCSACGGDVDVAGETEGPRIRSRTVARSAAIRVPWRLYGLTAAAGWDWWFSGPNRVLS